MVYLYWLESKTGSRIHTRLSGGCVPAWRSIGFDAVIRAVSQHAHLVSVPEALLELTAVHGSISAAMEMEAAERMEASSWAARQNEGPQL